MKRFLHFLQVALFVVLFPVLALAEEPGSPLAVALAGFCENVLFPILNAGLVILIGWAVVYVGKKYKIDALIAYEDTIRAAAYRGVTYAEEYAANKIKWSNIKISSSEKLNLAVAQVLSAAPKLTREQAVAYVESLLARIKGAGATGQNAVG